MVDIVIGPITVPNVQAEGTAEAVAIAAITGAYLVENVEYEYSDTVPEGEVISQSPAPATEVEPESTVTIIVSLGALSLSLPTGLGHVLVIKQKRRSRRKRLRRLRLVVRS